MLEQFKDTTATKTIFQLTRRIRAVSGGTSSSKTISILVWLIDYAMTVPNQVITVVAESVPHLKLGAIRDFQSIMTAQGYFKSSRWNQSDHIYTFKNSSFIEFISFDKFGKAHGPRRHILFINEANNIPWIIADQLITRTRKVVWLDWNPSEEFWFYTEMLGKRDDIDFVGDGGNYPPLTYVQNEALKDEPGQITIKEIESHRHNKNWWRVYGEGRLGEIEGRIYTGWKIIDEIPHEARLIVRGLDFGYTNDPTALVDIYYYNGGYILDEQLYQRGMKNDQIAKFILNLNEPNTLVKADSAEPKSIDEIHEYGVNILPAVKGKDSVNFGIQFVQKQKISITKRSVNGIKEYRNYTWMTDKEGKVINVPMDLWNHFLDGVRYGMEYIQPPNTSFDNQLKRLQQAAMEGE